MRGSMRERPNFRPGFFRRYSWIIVHASAALTLSACGGGGGGGSDPPSQPANPPAANTAPSNVQAGADQTITLPANSVQLQGSASDDGLPAPANLTYAWTVTSGSGVTFSAANAAATTATFPSAGTYVLTLTVSDGSLSTTDTVQVTVNAASGTAPTAQAGADQTIEFPFKASLQGSATDDGTPAPPALTYQWSGPSGVTFDNATAAATQASFPGPGTFELTLTVSDGASTGTDAVSVTVSPAVYPAADNNTQPDRGWTRVAAADVGMTQAGLDAATTYATTAGTTAPDSAGMVIRRGRLVHSWGNIDHLFDLKSTTKSIGGMALGLAWADGNLALTDTAITRLPSIAIPPDTNDDNGWHQQVTILQLATHTAGFQKPGGYIPFQFQPGTTWHYSDGGLNWLADLLTNVFGQDLRDVLNTRVWSAVGVNVNPADSVGDDVTWRAMSTGVRPDPRPNGIEHRELASGIRANVNAMARVGLLFLRRGVWGDQRILSTEFVDTVRVPHPSVNNANITLNDAANFPNAKRHYGVLWWTNADAAEADSQLPNVPADAYWAWGLGDSLIVVIPSLDLVVVRAGVADGRPLSTGRVWNDSDWNGDYSVLADFLNPIVTSVTTP